MRISLEPWALDLIRTSAPVFVSAPVGRSGTTAIQRLLNTDPSIAVYAEDDFLIQLVSTICDVATQLDTRRDADLAAREDLRVNKWMMAVLPDTDRYASGMFHAACHMIAVYQRDAERLGSQRWGLKRPGRSLAEFLAFRRILPRAQIVYVARDIVDCVRSHKAYYHDGRERHDARGLCDRWARNMRSWQAHRDSCLTVDYSRLENEPKAVAAELSEYLSLDLDASVLASRLNTGDGYRPPEPLTDEEERLCEAARAAVAGSAP